jgi:hypothetical protein
MWVHEKSNDNKGKVVFLLIAVFIVVNISFVCVIYENKK